MVTAPVQKSGINDAGIVFTGHTEYLAERCGVARPVMLLAAGSLRVALATTHLPLREVSQAITANSLDEILGIVDADLARARDRHGCGLQLQVVVTAGGMDDDLARGGFGHVGEGNHALSRNRAGGFRR
jgi:hypothetical protein